MDITSREELRYYMSLNSTLDVMSIPSTSNPHKKAIGKEPHLLYCAVTVLYGSQLSMKRN